MLSYTFWLSREALDFFESQSASNRKRLRDAFKKIAERPDLCDREQNLGGFLISYKKIGEWVITYRVDAPVNRVMISDITKHQ